MTVIVTTVEVPLSVPVLVQGADGKPAERSKLTLRRPKLRHTKMLAALIGADVVELISGMDLKSASGDIAETTEGKQLIAEVLRKLVSPANMDGLTHLIADLAGEDVSVIEDIDVVDMPALLMKFGDFFPALQSKAAGILARTSLSTGDTTRAQ